MFEIKFIRNWGELVMFMLVWYLLMWAIYMNLSYKYIYYDINLNILENALNLALKLISTEQMKKSLQ